MTVNFVAPPRAHAATALTFDGIDAAAAGSDVRPNLRQTAILTGSVWFASFALSTVRDLADPPAQLVLMTELRLAFAVLGALLCAPLWLLLNALRRHQFSTRALLVVPLSAVIATLYCQATFVVQRHTTQPSFRPTSDWQFYNTVYWLLFFLVWDALYLALSYSRQVQAQALLTHRMQALAHDAHLRALRYQVDPHFLFNALNSTSALVISERPEEAEAMLSKLASFFRASSALDPEADLSLRDEVALQRIYLEIEQVRFPDLSFEVAIPQGLLDARVPALILQPLVENSIKYAVATREAPTHISIVAEDARGKLVVVVEDDGSGGGRPSTGTGTGLRNTAARLDARFGKGASLVAGPLPSVGFRVRLELPRTTG